MSHSPVVAIELSRTSTSARVFLQFRSLSRQCGKSLRSYLVPMDGLATWSCSNNARAVFGEIPPAAAGLAISTTPTSRILGENVKVSLDVPETDWGLRGRKGIENLVKTY